MLTACAPPCSSSGCWDPCINHGTMFFCVLGALSEYTTVLTRRREWGASRRVFDLGSEVGVAD
jgi:hypothetical protein